PLGPAFVTPIAVFLLHPFGDLSKTEKTSLHHSFTAVSGGATAGKRFKARNASWPLFLVVLSCLL
ncbi:MAG: hypothetical protein ACK5U5_02860, partial [Burkholderiales bacterium]